MGEGASRTRGATPRRTMANRSSTTHEAAVKRGYELFTRKADNSCITCHAEFGRKPVLRYDVWGTVAKPADFSVTTLKGGSRPEDVFARVRGGISAVGMPAHPELTDRQVWDLVRFVKSVPYPARVTARRASRCLSESVA